MQLTPEFLAECRAVTRAEAAVLLLSGRGPLGQELAFRLPVILLAYWLHLAYIYGRSESVLGGKPAWEAREILASRVRSVAARTGTLSEWGSELLRSVRVRPERLPAEDQLWWRGRLHLFGDAPSWRRLRQRESLEEALMAWSLLREWLWQTHGGGSDAE